MKNGVYWVKFYEGNQNAQYSITSTGYDSPDRHYKMCRKCRNQYRNLIDIPMWYMGGCQFPKFEGLSNDLHYIEVQAEILNEQHTDLTGDEIPIHIVLPPNLSYYGIPINFN